MNKYRLYILMLLLAMQFNIANSAVVVNPNSGGSYYFEWLDGLGQIDGIEDPDTGTFISEVSWSINVSEDSILDYIKVSDIAIVGDSFDLYINNSLVAWTLTDASDDGHFQAQLSNYLLSAGTYNFSLYLVTLAPDINEGEGYIKFGATSPVAAVPEPSAAVLMLLAFCLFFCLFRKSKKSHIKRSGASILAD